MKRNYALVLLGIYVFMQVRLAAAFPFSDSLSPKKAGTYRASNTRSHDLIHTRLEVKFDWTKAQMHGKATITGKPYFKPTSKLSLDARGMELQSVEVFDLGKINTTGLSKTNNEVLPSKKLPATFKYENDSIKIDLGREFSADEKYLVKVNYIAKPNELKKGGGSAITDDRGLYFINPKGEEANKMPQIWTQGEIQANSAWFPTIDSPNEKMTTEIAMTVDSKYVTLSNGLLASSVKNSDGTRTDHWKMNQPHAPYLVMMAVGEFKKITDKPWNGKEISYYVEKEYEPYAKQIFGNTPEMIEFYSKVLGTPYPWAKYAQIVVRDYVSGAMENTSATLHGDQLLYQTEREMLDFKKGEAVIAHELFHQWFGDLVTNESWSNLPLNESFATYGEYLWEEYKNGRDAADAHSLHSRQGYFEASREKQVELIRFNYGNSEEMFDAFSYNKGGQVLHMLRKYVGDRAFFASLKLYLEQNKFKSAEIHHLRLAFEEVSGEDLNWFFNQWFLAKGHPQLKIEKTYDENSRELKLRVKQVHDLSLAPLYRLPVDIDIYEAGTVQRHRVMIDKEEQDFVFSCATVPELVNFDSERQLLGKKTFTKTTQEYLFQCDHAPLFIDRFEAVANLMEQVADPEIFKRIAAKAEYDPHWEIRELALEGLEKIAEQKENEVKLIVSRMAQNDKNNLVRGRAILFLANHYKDPSLTSIYKSYLNERSFAIISSALKALNKTDAPYALQKATEFEQEKNATLFMAVSEVYIAQGSDINSPYFLKSSRYFTGYDLYNFIKQYERFMERCTQPESFRTAASVFAGIVSGSTGYIRNTAKEAYQESVLNQVSQRIENLKKTETVGSEKIKIFEALLAELGDDYKKIAGD